MNGDINLEILSELKKLNRLNRLGAAVAIVALSALVLFLVAVYSEARQSTAATRAKKNRPWQEVRDASEQFDYTNAVKLLQGIIARQPSDYYGHAYLGNIYLAMGDITNAEVQYVKACDLLPDEQNEKMLKAIRKRIANEQAAQTASKP